MLGVFDGDIDVTHAMYEDMMPPVPKLANRRCRRNLIRRNSHGPKKFCHSTITEILPQCAVDVANRSQRDGEVGRSGSKGKKSEMSTGGVSHHK